MKKPEVVIPRPRLMGHVSVPYVTPRELIDNQPHRLDGSSTPAPVVPSRQETKDG